ncbi:MAG TPA: hypothetical protein VGB55_04925 [Tepidisphaeraceae bacterium]
MRSKAIAIPRPRPAEIRVMFWRVMLIVTAIAAAASAATIKDDANYFSDGAKQEAVQKLTALQEKNGQNVVIETFATVPQELAGKVEDVDAAKRQQMFGEFGKARKQALGASTYLMVSKSPSHLRVYTAQGQAEENRLAKDLINAIQSKRADQGLATFVDEVSGTRGSAAPAASNEKLSPSAFPGAQGTQSEPRRADAPARGEGAPAPASTGCGALGGFLPLILIGIVVMIIIRVIRGFSNRNRYNNGQMMNRNPNDPNAPGYGQPGYGQGQPGYGGGSGRGGGLGTGLAGGLAGGMLGGWLGSKVFGGQGTDAGAGNSGAAPTDPNADDNLGGGGDFTDNSSDFGGGGDFGGDGGGGDF